MKKTIPNSNPNYNYRETTAVTDASGNTENRFTRSYPQCQVGADPSHVVWVTGREAEIVHAAALSEEEQFCRACNNIEVGMIPVIYFDETPTEIHLSEEMMRLHEKYRKKQHLLCWPYLAPYGKFITGD